ncbi:hypothetical protein GOB86_07735 [Acetobacter lambici]|uniref:DUF2946 domain-containing protein n=1 Tax=Acetobacter lambici TaxID=1332824 RepID=A0ABT1F101_9PROT|nr:hypothetical protein [Acetobacter lambici]MCP1242473.1 hypothetical protein [Acetobacter lambici]MCP1258661.1 hypothetical protein [Acetobacter lambici]NHO56954.1 hypothetical protein [Acetobacter lambici]
MLCLFSLRQMVLGCLLVLAAATGLLAPHTPAQAAHTGMVHATMQGAAHATMANATTMHHHSPTAIGCPSTTAATHHLMHHHAACCMTGNALSVVDTSVGMQPIGFLWHTRARPVFAPVTALPDRRAAPLLRPPKLHTA